MGAVKEVWGVIRPDKNGKWEVLKDKYHKPQGIEKVSQTNVYVKIHYKAPFNVIHWTSVTPDEKMIFHNIQVGASARLDCAKVYFAKRGIPLNPEMLQLGDKSNFWFYVKGE
jgi:hypothetical protein